MRSVLNFLTYNNAVPIAVSLMLLGAGGAFAATNPETIYSESQRVLSVDNTYLVNKDLGTFSPRTQITTVTEDAENYYVDYVLYTIDLEDYTWKDVQKPRQMKVAKASLGEYRDLGVYVTGQLKENIDEEIRRLSETQEIERRSVSQKVVATEYGGLIGKMLDTSTETLPGYTPVVTPPPEVHVAAASEAVAQGSPGSPQNGEPTSSQSTYQSAEGAPTLQVLGNNPARIPLGSAYADLGAAITGPTPTDQLLGIHIFVGDVEVQAPSIDTSAVGEWIVRYEATNADGKKGVATRTVVVFDPYPPVLPLETSGSAATSTADTTISTTTDTTTSEGGNAPLPEAPAESATSTAPAAQ